MPVAHRFRSFHGVCIVLLVLAVAPPLCLAQSGDGFPTGKAAAVWDKWQAAMKALLARDANADAAFGELLVLEPSPLRLALLAERTVMRGPDSGSVLLFEQDAQNNALGENGKKLFDMLEVGREQLNQADDGFYFSSIGRFDVANANFLALLESDADPVALMEFVDRVPRRLQVLVDISDNPVVGGAARRVLGMIQRGESAAKADPRRIQENIERLSRGPRAFENGVTALRQSGEYAVPFLLQTLRDPSKQELVQPILRTLPAIGRAALNPLVVSLEMEDDTAKQHVIEALAQIGYAQAVPYLLKLREEKSSSPQIRAAVDKALGALRGGGVRMDTNETAANAFFALAEGYYDEIGSLSPDPRKSFADVWYWRENMLENIEVPAAIFNDVMAMRCAEESLKLDPERKPALALWLAANYRREARLPSGAPDHTRPENYPTAAYFAQSAGPVYNLMMLARALDDKDSVVALGAIDALRRTSGPASLTQVQDGRLPLGEALTFPDRMVRVRAALALGRAQPREQFTNYQNLLPVLGEALGMHGGARYALVVDPDTEGANAIAAALREAQFNVIIDSSLFGGLNKARGEAPGLDAVVVASDIAGPALPEGLAQLRGEPKFASTPVLIVAKPGGAEAVRDLIGRDPRMGMVTSNDAAQKAVESLEAVSRAAGVVTMNPEGGIGIALDAAETLQLLGRTAGDVFKVQAVEAALVDALKTADPGLRVAVAQALGFVPSRAAQEAIAAVALKADEAEPMRVAMFEALAHAAKQHGSQLSDDLIKQLIQLVQSEPNMVIRTAASQALGALNLPGNPASEIIRAQSRG